MAAGVHRLCGRFSSPQFGHSWNASTLSESWLRRMPRLDGEVFLLGTAISATLFLSRSIARYARTDASATDGLLGRGRHQRPDASRSVAPIAISRARCKRGAGRGTGRQRYNGRATMASIMLPVTLTTAGARGAASTSGWRSRDRVRAARGQGQHRRRRQSGADLPDARAGQFRRIYALRPDPDRADRTRQRHVDLAVGASASLYLLGRIAHAFGMDGACRAARDRRHADHLAAAARPRRSMRSPAAIAHARRRTAPVGPSIG